MNCRIVNEESFYVLGKTSVHSTAGGRNKRSIPAFWDECRADGTIGTLLNAASDAEYVFGICFEAKNGGEEFDYAIAVRCEKDAPVPHGFVKTLFPARTWAVFECVGAMPDAIQKLWDEISAKYFPNAPYRPTGEAEIEAYPDGDVSDEGYRCEIRIPVVKK